MKMYDIKIDNEVMEYLKKHAVPFEDTPNDAIRKLLDLNGNRQQPIVRIVNSTASGLPLALQQILEVYAYVRNTGCDRSTATNFVARQRRITPQTVIDKYARQLGKNTYEIDNLMRPENIDDFKSLLIFHFPKFKKSIELFFADFK